MFKLKKLIKICVGFREIACEGYRHEKAQVTMLHRFILFDFERCKLGWVVFHFCFYLKMPVGTQNWSKKSNTADIFVNFSLSSDGYLIFGYIE